MSNYRAIFLERSTKRHGKMYDYTHTPTSFSYCDWVLIGCPKHGTFRQKARTHVAGSGCPQCAHERRQTGVYARKRHTKDQFIVKARAAHGDFYDYSSTVYEGQMKRLTVRCPTHGLFVVMANNHVHGTGCAKCKRSRGETLIQLWLEEHNIEYEAQKTFPKFFLPHTKKHTNKPKYDFYVPSHNLLIEFDGKHHFEPVRFHGVDQKEANRLHRKTVLADKLKAQFADENGYVLLRIPYTQIKILDRTLTATLL